MKKHLRITVNGKIYEVEAEIIGEEGSRASAQPARGVVQAAAAAPQAPQSGAGASASAPRPSAAGPGEMPSPLAGKVVSIGVEVGSEVKSGQAIMVLEAMKMNTEVTSPADGKVKAIHVGPGDSVEEGQSLMTIE